MSPYDIEAAVLELYDAYNSRQFDRAALLVAPEVELRDIATGETRRGPQGLLQFVRGWAAAFPDGAMQVVHVETADRAAAVELVLRGTHTGTLIGAHGHVPPTWAEIEIEACDVLHFTGGQIAKLDRYLDTGNLLRQMGLLPNSPLHAPERRATLELYALAPESSLQQRNRATVRRFVEQVVNKHSADAASDYHIANLTWHAGSIGEAYDVATYQRHLRGLFEAFPDLSAEISDLVTENDRVVIRASVRGTHLGPFLDQPPTGKVIRGSCSVHFRMVDGMIAEEWWNLDLLGFLRQIDAIPSALSAATPRR